MCRAPHYQVCSFETDRADLPLVEFAALKLDCQMVVLSAHSARLIIVPIADPFAGPLSSPRAGFGKLNITAIDYLIYCERENGKFRSVGFRHEFPRPAQLKGSVIEARPHKLFKLMSLGVLLGLKEFNCTRAIQFTA